MNGATGAGFEADGDRLQLAALVQEIGSTANSLRSVLIEAVAADDLQANAALVESGRRLAELIGWMADIATSMLGCTPVRGDAAKWMLPLTCLPNRGPEGADQ